MCLAPGLALRSGLNASLLARLASTAVISFLNVDENPSRALYGTDCRHQRLIAIQQVSWHRSGKLQLRSSLRLALLMAEPVLKRIAPQMDRSVFQVFVGPLRLLLSVAGFRAGMEWIGPAALLRLALDHR